MVCTAVPPEMLIQITPVTDQSFDLEISVLTPDEVLHTIMTRPGPDGQMIIEQTFDGRLADDNGRFTTRERVHEPAGICYVLRP
ncbi:MAG: hypothetical protein KF770_28790 [Anaerolineae bacterium]|nr:hypothetical protein [Anaerolineae bacterium]